MKKIIAIILAIVMMASMSVVAFADAAATDNAGNFLGAGDVGGTDITYSTSQAYTVEIPGDFSLVANTPEEKEVTVSNYLLAKGATLTISITSQQVSGDAWVLRATGADDVPYTIKKLVTPADGENPAVTSDVTVSSNVVLTANTNEAAVEAEAVTQKLIFETEGTSQVANFAARITFVATITPPTNA